MDTNYTTAILLLHCPDKQGIISEVTKFITDNKGNIVYLDQYVDKVDGMFFMRIEWELEGFLIPREKLYDYITTLYSQRYQMKFSLYYSDKRPRMAIFVSKMSHCLYDLLARWKAGEFNCDIPCIVSNHEDLRYAFWRKSDPTKSVRNSSGAIPNSRRTFAASSASRRTWRYFSGMPGGRARNRSSSVA